MNRDNCLLSAWRGANAALRILGALFRPCAQRAVSGYVETKLAATPFCSERGKP
jgi:hypothetical protein